MFLFSRVVTLIGSPRRVMPWATDITAYVNANSTLQVGCWAANFGYPIGTVAWSAMVDSQATLADATAKLLSEEGYLDLLDAGSDLLSMPGQDFLREVVYGEPGEPPPIGAVARITTATAAVDRIPDALGWAVDIAKYAEGVIGTPIAVFADVFATMGGITWISVQPDIVAAETAGTKLRDDSAYLSRLVATKDLYLPGSAHVGQVTRIA